MKIEFLEIEHVMAIHDTLIDAFGGTYGLRDKGLLESALAQPQQSFGGEDLYPSLFDKAAAYAFFLSESQCFLDGNKRTAATVSAVFLDLHHYELTCPEGAVYDMIMAIANKRLSREELSLWFKKHSKKKK